MLPAIINHLWQSTLFAIATFALALILRNNRPQVRYWLWLAASLKFLVPFSLLVSAGRQVEIQTPAPPIATAVTEIAVQVSQPFESIQPVYSEPARLPAIPVLWACGSLTVLALWIRKALRLRQVVRHSAPLPGMLLDIPVRVSSTLIEPGVVGLLRPILLVPEGLLRNLTAEQFAGILAHELCHVRRRDNLAAAFHMGVEAIFWFHPLVWWIGSRLVEERERACDEEVLRLGTSPETYAQSILSVCKFYLRSPLPCASGVTGADLKKRVLYIMKNAPVRQLDRTRKLLLACSALAAVAIPLMFGALSSNAQVAGSARYDVVSIRPNTTGQNGSSLEDTSAGSIRAVNITVEKLLTAAFDIRDFQIEGAPEWIKSERFDIQAKLDQPDKRSPRDMTRAQRDEHIARHRERLRNVLADRFNMRSRLETRDKPGYVLTLANRGSHKLLPQSVDEHSSSTSINSNSAQFSISAQGLSMKGMVEVLSNALGRAVVDETGISGLHDFKLEWTPDEAAASAAGKESKGSMFTAIREQLGLKLESRKTPTRVIVVEHIEKPSEN